MKLLLDEHFAPRIASTLRDRHAVDAIAVTEVPALVGASDEEILTWATAQSRAAVTENARDFILLVRELGHTGGAHGGLILTTARAFPRSRDGIGRLVDALATLVDDVGPDRSLADREQWLRPDDRARRRQGR